MVVTLPLNGGAGRLQGAASVPQIYAVAAPVRQQQQIAQVQAAPVQAFQVVPVQIASQQQRVASSGPILAAVQSRRNVQFIDVPSNGGAGPLQTIVIGPSVQPLDFEFVSQSSPISVRQSHIPGRPNPPQESSHTDEPDVLRQTITKPIIHTVEEVVQPIRRISQQVNPVQETITQTFAKEQQKQQQAAAVVAVAQPITVAAVAAQPTETIAVETVAAAEQPIIAIEAAGQALGLENAVAAPQTVLLVEGGVSGGVTGSLQTRTLPINARITRF